MDLSKIFFLFLLIFSNTFANNIKSEKILFSESLFDFYYFKIKNPYKKYRPSTLLGMHISKEFRSELEKSQLVKLVL